MNGQLAYECDECGDATPVEEKEIETFSSDHGLIIKFTSECIWCDAKLEVEFSVKDE